ncbi:MAG TPA: sigma-E factor regulatory protein RseB domain-containing protein [Dermatophilaceae bacterium]|nr:sigma-E factor regulatory protein RseB domain-containing protein [Dermatophilaceae bacterium]
MTAFARHPAARWLVPATAAALVAGGTVAARSADADPTLPPRTAAQLLVDVQKSDVTALSGTVEQAVDLGLPELPGLSGGGGAGGPSGGSSAGGAPSLTSVLSGTHTWRVWADGPDRQRLALVDGSAETAVVRDGRTAWLWSSADKSAVRYTLPAKDASKAPAPGDLPTDLPRTPQEAADRALAALDPTTAVTTAGTATVAGRAAYELVLDPRTDATRVTQVRLAVDAEEGVPLRVQVWSSKADEPVVDVGFTSVSFDRPAASAFAFTPPEGATVSEGELPTAAERDAARSAEKPDAERPTVVGTGWSSVVVARLPDAPTASGSDDPATAVLDALPRVSGDWGSGRLVDGTLVSVVLTDDGRVAVGAVPPSALYAALARG